MLAAGPTQVGDGQLAGWSGRGWPVTLRHGAVTLRPLRASDARRYHELRARNWAWTGPWDSTRPPGAKDEPLTFSMMVRSFNREARAGRMLPWGIEVDGALSGQLTISGIVRGSAQWGQAGYWVDQQVAGRGVMPTALALGADHMLLTMGLHRLEVAIRPENAKSLRVVEKLGLRLEGTRPRYMHVDGEWRDHLVYVVHAEELGPGGLLGRLTGTSFGDSPKRLNRSE